MINVGIGSLKIIERGTNLTKVCHNMRLKTVVYGKLVVGSVGWFWFHINPFSLRIQPFLIDKIYTKINK